MENLLSLWASSGLAQAGGQAIMMLVGFGLLYLAISRGFEPLLLVPIGFGTVLICLERIFLKPAACYT